MRHRNFWPLVALAALLVFNLIFTTGFARVEFRDGRLFGTLVDIFQNGAPVMLLAVGMTLVIALGGIDLSVGSVMALSGAVAALLMTEHGQSVPVGVLAALGVALLVGAINGALVSYASVQPIIVTLVTLVMGRGLAQALTQDQKIRFEIPAFEFIGNGTVLGLPFPVLLVAAVAVAVSVLLRRTATGLYIEAMGGNPQAARLCGLRVHVIRLMAFMACALCAGLAGLIAAADIKEADVANAGLYLELDAILAVVLGGTSLTGGRANLVGSLIGATFIQTLTIMLQMRGVITEHTLIIKAIVALSVCYMQTPSFERMVRRLRPAEGA
ncbi:monosaccharide ABC transporter membrane protein, CUT2 family [Stigmatella aurantiaca]|uniref:Monosaccharide ABC transporter membrane protein, CUT2 family n=1 Tax=Stigmatella aurantiaca TaxID=41 RepID=A0A1H7JHX3_STIAU|nr:ABC transporter permease [Stigmatella aurantiaca]SEK74278.1 monosaccharide ABC transporter membrane protein, CUT2 family [Stigmatella aurantiaca]